MEKLADNLQRLGEDDLLQVVSMVHENKTADTYTKNDVERKIPHSPFRITSPRLQAKLRNRRRISCRPLHASRQPDSYAVGVLARKAWCIGSFHGTLDAFFSFLP